MRARARSSTCSPSTPTSSAATRAGRTPGTRSCATARRSSSTTSRPGSSTPARVCVVGAGCVIDPRPLVEEIDGLEERGIPTGDLRISGNAHLIMPWHVAIDSASERRLGKLQIGTTRRGIGPAYADKASRIGIRDAGRPRPEDPAPEVRDALAEKNVLLERLYDAPAARARGARRPDGGVRRAAAAVRRGHVAPRRPGARRREARPARRRAGDAARPRPRHVSVRHVVEPDRGRGDDGRRHRADAHRPRDRRREGVRHARRRRAVPDRDRGARPGARARDRRGVRHDDRARAPLRLARPRRRCASPSA